MAEDAAARAQNAAAFNVRNRSCSNAIYPCYSSCAVLRACVCDCNCMRGCVIARACVCGLHACVRA